MRNNLGFENNEIAKVTKNVTETQNFGRNTIEKKVEFRFSSKIFDRVRLHDRRDGGLRVNLGFEIQIMVKIQSKKNRFFQVQDCADVGARVGDEQCGVAVGGAGLRALTGLWGVLLPAQAGGSHGGQCSHHSLQSPPHHHRTLLRHIKGNLPRLFWYSVLFRNRKKLFDYLCNSTFFSFSRHFNGRVKLS